MNPFRSTPRPSSSTRAPRASLRRRLDAWWRGVDIVLEARAAGVCCSCRREARGWVKALVGLHRTPTGPGGAWQTTWTWDQRSLWRMELATATAAHDLTMERARAELEARAREIRDERDRPFVHVCTDGLAIDTDTGPRCGSCEAICAAVPGGLGAQP